MSIRRDACLYRTSDRFCLLLFLTEYFGGLIKNVTHVLFINITVCVTLKIAPPPPSSCCKTDYLQFAGLHFLFQEIQQVSWQLLTFSNFTAKYQSEKRFYTVYVLVFEKLPSNQTTCFRLPKNQQIFRKCHEKRSEACRLAVPCHLIDPSIQMRATDLGGWFKLLTSPYSCSMWSSRFPFSVYLYSRVFGVTASRK